MNINEVIRRDALQYLKPRYLVRNTYRNVRISRIRLLAINGRTNYFKVIRIYINSFTLLIRATTLNEHRRGQDYPTTTDLISRGLRVVRRKMRNAITRSLTLLIIIPGLCRSVITLLRLTRRLLRSLNTSRNDNHLTQLNVINGTCIFVGRS